MKFGVLYAEHYPRSDGSGIAVGGLVVPRIKLELMTMNESNHGTANKTEGYNAARLRLRMRTTERRKDVWR